MSGLLGVGGAVGGLGGDSKETTRNPSRETEKTSTAPAEDSEETPTAASEKPTESPGGSLIDLNLDLLDGDNEAAEAEVREGDEEGDEKAEEADEDESQGRKEEQSDSTTAARGTSVSTTPETLPASSRASETESASDAETTRAPSTLSTVTSASSASERGITTAAQDTSSTVPDEDEDLEKETTTAAQQTPAPIPDQDDAQEEEPAEPPVTETVTPLDASTPSEVSKEGTGIDGPNNFVPIVGASAGGLLFLMVVAIIMTARYKRRRWPFKPREKELDPMDEDNEKGSVGRPTSRGGGLSKWDPSSRLSKFITNKNF